MENTMKNQKPTRREFLQRTGWGAMALVAGELLRTKRVQAATATRPNILIVMADDMGFSDAGCFGGEIETPNLDRLAANGLRFTQFYNCARCCPTRASLLTGLYPHQVGLKLNGRNLTRNGVTIAEALKGAGYHTAMAGKWHLSRTAPLPDKTLHQKWLDHQYDPGKPFAPVETYPANRGFDKHYGVIWGVIDFFDPFSLVEGTKAVKDVPKDYYFTDAITDKSVEYIHELSTSDKPFFMYVAHCAPHWPLHARPEDIAKYKNRYQGGWEKLRQERYELILKMGLLKKENTPLPSIQGWGKSWNDLSAQEKKFQSAKMAVHAAMIDRVDQGIGKIINALKETGRFENTMIIFLCDNGASPETPREPGYDRSRQTRDGRTIRYRGIPAAEVGSETSYCGIGSYWSSASNTPFRYWKKESFEGGCHTPLVIHWPKGLKTKAGSITEQAGHVMDILPTCLELAGAKYPGEYQGNTITPLEGKSLLPILKGQKREGHEMLFFEHEGGRAVRIGDWKLVALANRKWELYHVAADRTETHNLAERYPDKVKAMLGQWQQWARRVGLGNPS
jgi:arylsulfatase A-like enzyme